MAKCTKSPEDLKAAAAAIVKQHKPIKDVMLDLGYSENVAKKGKHGMPAQLMKECLEYGKEFIEIGKAVNATQVEQLVTGRLIHNTIMGDNAGNEAAKCLGGMKKYQLFQADSQVGVIVLASPNLQPAGKPLRELDAHDLDMLDGEVIEQKKLPE